MTQAVCYQCGALKRGAFLVCEECRATPTTEEERVVSLAMTEHHFDAAALGGMSDTIRRTGKPPELEPETRRRLTAMLREANDVLPHIGLQFGAEAERAQKEVVESLVRCRRT
ncbi:MAG: hypothetical protein QM811_22250 [Pirellulales bacterium]